MTRRLVVVGDSLLDTDLQGHSERLCPDAPVPVLDVDVAHHRAGGAGLAATMLACDGHEVTLVTAVGDDDDGRRLTELLGENGVRVLPLPTTGHTRSKTRMRAGRQSLLRVDAGTDCPPSEPLPADLAERTASADAVLVSDYGGGVTADARIRNVLGVAARRSPLVWDPHVRGPAPVPHATVVTPNASEAAALAGETSVDPSLASAVQHAELLVRRWQCGAVCVTLGRRGAVVSWDEASGPPLVATTTPAEAGDTCGAGDRFAATVTAALAERRVLSEAVVAAVEAATSYVRSGGPESLVASRPPSAAPDTGWERVERVQRSGGTVVATGGCFDLLHAGHVQLLTHARALGDCLVVLVNSDESVRRLKGNERPLVPAVDRVQVLSTLAPVDAVLVFEEDDPSEALDRLRPQLWVKGADYAMTRLPEADVLAQWGGQAVLVPYLDGHSTSRLLDAARGGVGSIGERVQR